MGEPGQRPRRWADLVEAGPYASSGIDMIVLALRAGIGVVVLVALGLLIVATWVWWVR